MIGLSGYEVFMCAWLYTHSLNIHVSSMQISVSYTYQKIWNLEQETCLDSVPAWLCLLENFWPSFLFL